MSETVPKDAKANGTKIVAKKAKANGTISCRISGACSGESASCQPCICEVTFTPDSDHSIKHGKHQFAAFVPEKAKSEYGFVEKLCNGRIDVVAKGLCCPSLLSQVALLNTKVTVVVSRPCCDEDGTKLKLVELIVPAESAK